MVKWSLVEENGRMELEIRMDEGEPDRGDSVEDLGGNKLNR